MIGIQKFVFPKALVKYQVALSCLLLSLLSLLSLLFLLFPYVFTVFYYSFLAVKPLFSFASHQDASQHSPEVGTF